MVGGGGTGRRGRREGGGKKEVKGRGKEWGRRGKSKENEGVEFGLYRKLLHKNIKW